MAYDDQDYAAQELEQRRRYGGARPTLKDRVLDDPQTRQSPDIGALGPQQDVAAQVQTSQGLPSPASPAPQPSLTQRVLGGLTGQPGGGAGGLAGRVARGAIGGALGPTQRPDIEAERQIGQRQAGAEQLESQRLAGEQSMLGQRLGVEQEMSKQRLAELIAATQMRGATAEDVARITGASREAAAGTRAGATIGAAQIGAESRGTIAQQMIAERQYEANLRAQTQTNLGMMRIEAAKQLRLMPPGQIRSMAYTAQAVINEMPRNLQLIDEAESQGLLGPLVGRWSDLAYGKIGVDNPTYQALNERMLLTISASLRTHFGARGGQIMFDRFLQNLNTAGQSAANIKSALNEVSNWFNGYVQMAIDPNFLQGQTKPPLESFIK